MSNTGLSVKNEAVREVAFGSINATYTSLGAVLTNDAFTVSMFNDTDQNIYVSTDASTDHIKVAAQTGRVFDYKTNDLYRKAGTQFSIKYDAGAATTGGFWIETEYA
jgi:hypothetical protein